MECPKRSYTILECTVGGSRWLWRDPCRATPKTSGSSNCVCRASGPQGSAINLGDYVPTVIGADIQHEHFTSLRKPPTPSSSTTGEGMAIVRARALLASFSRTSGRGRGQLNKTFDGVTVHGLTAISRVHPGSMSSAFLGTPCTFPNSSIRAICKSALDPSCSL